MYFDENCDIFPELMVAVIDPTDLSISVYGWNVLAVVNLCVHFNIIIFFSSISFPIAYSHIHVCV